MPDILVYLLLSLGSGAAYALLANGIVAMYKGSGILNFAQGGVAMFAAYCYMQLMTDGSSKLVALAIVLAGAAVFGVVFSIIVVRPLRNAPVLAKVVVTLGLLVGLQGLASLIWGEASNPVESLFPVDSISVGGDTQVGVDRLYMFGTAVVIATALWALYRFTRLGLATQAASENEVGASLLGFSPTVIASINWALGSALAALAGVLIAAITTLDSATMPMLVLPALAAALVGRFSSFGVTTAAAFLIGWIQTTLLNTWEQPGVQTAAPFVVVIVVMAFAGRALPTRGALSEGRPPKAPAGDNRWALTAAAVVVAVVALVSFNATYQAAFATSLTMAILALSLVVLTGYVGQISLMQLTFAGIGGFITAKLASDLGFPFPLSIIAGAVIIAPISALLGVPALRIRGLSLAVVTLGAAVAVDAVLFQNQDWTGGLDGMAVPSASLFGASVDPFEHPVRYGLVVLFTLVVVAILVGNIRRSGIGRRMLAVRSNERAAAVAGVNVAAIKLQAFTVAGVIAAISGGLLAYSNPFIVFGSGQFSALPSITLLTLVYLGGIASVSGGIMAGVVSSGGVMYVLLSGIGGFDDYFAMVSGVLLILTVLLQPDGAMVAMAEQIRWVGRKLRGGDGGSPGAGAPGDADPAPRVADPGGERVPVS